MTRRMLRSTVLLSGLLGAWLAAAQPPARDAEADAEPATPRYRVEFIVFAHNGASPDERLPTSASLPSTGAPAQRRWPFGIRPETGEFGEPVFSDRPGSGEPGVVELEPPRRADTPDEGGTAAAEPDPAETADVGDAPADDGIKLFGPPAFQERRLERWFEPLPADALVLGDTRRALDRLGAYRVLAHGGWEQDAMTEEQARPLDLGALGISNPSGTLTLFVSRYTHVIVDLRYRTDALGTRAPGRAFGPRPRLYEIDTVPSYVLQARRRVTRAGDLHYIDHPLFGVLVSITEAPEEPEAAEPDDGGLTPAA